MKLNKKGEPARVSGLSVTNATYTCNDKTSGTVSKSFPGSAKVTKQTDADGKVVWIFNMPFNPGTGTEFTGESNRKGTRVTGGVSYDFSKGPEGEIVCGFFKGFTATK